MKSRTERWTIGAGKYNQELFEQRQEEYFKNPDKCLFCNSDMPYIALAERKERRFCKRSCAAKFNNKNRLESNNFYQKGLTKDCFCILCKKNIKIGKNGSSNRAKCNECKLLTHKSLIKKCKNCNSEFKTETKKSYCSTNCLSIMRKHIGSLGGKKSASKRIKRSKDEIKLYNLCNTYFNSVRHNEIIKDGWDADIIIDDYKIAILWNGPWHYRQLTLKNHSLKQVQNRDKIKINTLTLTGWKVLVFEDRFYNPSQAFEEVKKIAGAGFEPL